MRIQEDLKRFETHYTTMVKLFLNMLDEMDEARVRNIAKNAIDEALEIQKQEKEE